MRHAEISVDLDMDESLRVESDIKQTKECETD